jgi:hypothetical protein
VLVGGRRCCTCTCICSMDASFEIRFDYSVPTVPSIEPFFSVKKNDLSPPSDAAHACVTYGPTVQDIDQRVVSPL